VPCARGLFACGKRGLWDPNDEIGPKKTLPPVQLQGKLCFEGMCRGPSEFISHLPWEKSAIALESSGGLVHKLLSLFFEKGRRSVNRQKDIQLPRERMP